MSRVRFRPLAVRVRCRDKRFEGNARPLQFKR